MPHAHRARIDWSTREKQILDLIVAGKTNGEIAETLGIAFPTAKWHVSELITKLGVTSREEVAGYWRMERRPQARLRRALPWLFASTAAKAAGATVALATAAGIVFIVIALGGHD